MASSPSALETAVELLSGVYNCHSNEDRRVLTLRLLDFEEHLSTTDYLHVGVSLLSVTDYGAAVQAYGAVMLRHGLNRAKINVSQVPLWDLLSWYCNEPAISKIFCADLSELFIECLIHGNDDVLPRMLGVLCPTQDISQHQRRILLLHGLVKECVDPDFERVPKNRVGRLRSSMKRAGTTVLQVATQSLFGLFNAAGGEASRVVSSEMDTSLEACLSMVGTIAPLLPLGDWTAVSLGDTLDALLRWIPSQRYAVVATTSILGCAERADDAMTDLLRLLLMSVLSIVPAAVEARELDVVDEIIILCSGLPKSLVQSVGLPVCQALVSIMAIPSLYFACEVCGVLQWVDEATLAHVNPLDIYVAIHSLVKKGQFHPETGTVAEGKQLSIEQLGYVGMYERTLADLRGQAGKLLDILARLHPALSNQFIFKLIESLCDHEGTQFDARTRSGFVTQQSETFLSWEAVSYMVNHLSDAFRYASEYVPDCIKALTVRQPRDAVLLPLYLNMLSCFWRCRDDAALNVWEGTLAILFSCIEGIKRTDDLDVTAARRRAHTLLVNASAEHAFAMGPVIINNAIQKVQNLLVKSTSQERSLLYESLTAFAAALPGREGDAQLSTIITPIVLVIDTDIGNLSQAEFNAVIVGAAVSERDKRYALRDALNILAAIFRRSRMTPYVGETVTRILPLLGKISALLHGMKAAELPVGFKDLLEMDSNERQQFLPGHTKRSHADPRAGGISNKQLEAVRAARNALVNIRVSLYQLYGAICPFSSTDSLLALLNSLANSVALLPVHHMRQLAEKCLMPIGENHPQIMSTVLATLRDVFLRRMEEQQQQEEEEAHYRAARYQRLRETEEDVAAAKNWFYFAKDVMTFTRRRVMEPGLWKQSADILQGVCELLVAVMESNADPRSASYAVKDFVELKCEADAPYAAVLTRTQSIAFSRLLLYIMCSSEAVVSAKDKEAMAFSATEPFVLTFPRFHECLAVIGVSPAAADELHARLILSNNVRNSRNKVKEFLLLAAKKYQEERVLL